VNYVAVSGIFNYLYGKLNAPNLSLAFPAVLVLALICFLFSAVLSDKLFRADWTDGYHMTDIPVYAQAFHQTEKIDKEKALGLTPREMEILTLLLTEMSQKEIASTIKISRGTYNFHSANLYRKLGVQSRQEIFSKYGS
jgi:DNA-binding CsgD family transcriptional regulator